jgi:hypothetical protein
MNKQLHTHIPNFSADTEMINTSEGVKDQNSSSPGAMFQRGILEWKLRFTRKSKKVAMRFEHTQGNLNLNQDRYGVCIHEAGQMAVAFRLYDYEGHPECSVTNDTSGYVNLDFSSLNSSPRYRAVVALAGPVAELSGAVITTTSCLVRKNRDMPPADWTGSQTADDMTVALMSEKGGGTRTTVKASWWTVATGSLILECGMRSSRSRMILRRRIYTSKE